MNNTDLNALATYNSERARGLLHNGEWIVKMMELQQQFNLETYGVENPEPGKLYPRPSRSAGEGR